MSTASQSTKVQKLNELFQESRRTTTEYKTWLGEIVDAVKAHDVPSVKVAFSMALNHATRLREIIGDDVRWALEDPDEQPRQGPNLRKAISQLPAFAEGARID